MCKCSYVCNYTKGYAQSCYSLIVNMQCPWNEEESDGRTSDDITKIVKEEFDWKVLLKWATASKFNHFPGTKPLIIITDTG